jgi:hypothetical protein
MEPGNLFGGLEGGRSASCGQVKPGCLPNFHGKMCKGYWRYLGEPREKSRLKTKAGGSQYIHRFKNSDRVKSLEE